MNLHISLGAYRKGILLIIVLVMIDILFIIASYNHSIKYVKKYSEFIREGYNISTNGSSYTVNNTNNTILDKEGSINGEQIDITILDKLTESTLDQYQTSKKLYVVTQVILMFTYLLYFITLSTGTYLLVIVLFSLLGYYNSLSNIDSYFDLQGNLDTFTIDSYKKELSIWSRYISPNMTLLAITFYTVVMLIV